MERSEDHDFHGYRLAAATRGGQLMVAPADLVRALGLHWPEVKARLDAEADFWLQVRGIDEGAAEDGATGTEYLTVDRLRLLTLTLHWERCSTAELVSIVRLQRAVLAELEDVNFSGPPEEDNVVKLPREEYDRLKAIDQRRRRMGSANRVSEEDAAAMENAYLAGEGMRKIGKRFGRAPCTVSYVLKSRGINTKPGGARGSRAK